MSDGVDSGLPDDGDLLPGSVDALRIERVDVVDGRKIGRRKTVAAAERKGVVTRLCTERPHAEIVQPANPQHQRPDRRGHRRLGRICEMCLAVDQILVNLGLKRRFNLRGRAVYRDPAFVPAQHSRS